MSDYIKREDAIKALEGWKISGEMILAIVQTADVAEVVRCKDCKHFDNETKWTVCTMWSADPYEQASVGKNDYCSFGERKES